MGTLTAPGADVLGWDTDHCGHLDGECSGDLGCRVDPVAAALWHASVARRWSWFVTYLRRATGCDVQYMKVYEWQKRGALHVHYLFRVTGVVSERRLRAAVRLAAYRWDFGRQLRVDFISADDARARARSAGYAAKYCSKGYDDLDGVPMLDASTGELRTVCLRPWSASRGWGLTMKGASLLRVQWWEAGGSPKGGPGSPLTCMGTVPQPMVVMVPDTSLGAVAM